MFYFYQVNSHIPKTKKRKKKKKNNNKKCCRYIKSTGMKTTTKRFCFERQRNVDFSFELIRNLFALCRQFKTFSNILRIVCRTFIDVGMSSLTEIIVHKWTNPGNIPTLNLPPLFFEVFDVYIKTCVCFVSAFLFLSSGCLLQYSVF